MPKSIETSSEFDFSNEPHQQPSVSSQGGAATVGGGGKEQQQANLSVAVAAAAAVVAASNCKKYRHQNYSKNIYIGTKNAEKWEKVRSVLSFKNDVEFVSYLLRLAEIDLADNNGLYSRESFAANAITTNTSSSSSSRKGTNEKFTTDTDTDQESLSASFRGQLDGALSSSMKTSDRHPGTGTKKVKRVQFQDGLSPGAGPSPPPPSALPSRPNRPVTPTIIPGIPILAAARLFESAAEFRRNSLDDDEVLDCRIAEKIKTELKEYNKARSDGKNLSLINRDPAGEFADPPDVEEGVRAIKRDTDMGDEDDCEDEDGQDNHSQEESSTTEFQKALCLAAALQQSTEAVTVKERPVKRKGRPPTKNKPSKPGEPGGGQPRKRGPAKMDIRKAPPHEVIPADLRAKLETCDSGESENDLSEDEEEQFHNNSENSMDSEKGPGSAYECSYCDEIHSSDDCPIRQSSCLICDSIEKFRWMDENQDILEKIKPDPALDGIRPEDDEIGDLLEEDNPDEDLNDASSDEEDSVLDMKAEDAANAQAALLLKRREEEDQLPSYCDATVPEQFEVVKSEIIGSKVVARTLIPKHMKLGPLVGRLIHVKDIPDDCTMKEVYEIHNESRSHFLSTSDKNESNWLRYIRPAPTRDQRNVVIVWMGQPEGNVSEVYFITCKDIGEGCELFYWSDHMNSAWGRKKIDKMNCGGCNLKFEHPLYYRTHCSVFHDPAFSLTIRKYHCKVCGVAVLGKDNIMQHAAEMHEGKGAYQCQFCKKYFLRLNYLEMHRTYGCSANPQRARPLCDFCGRKFCQPQKLKVHIKRMHSADMADVLRDFQCKLCSKLLGSRAALQRHSKEVHSRNSAVVSCPRCQKLFQNRSNLKIHMLTHSGVRPFKCAENGCQAAFTTKQCLQFHYKKVHGYTQEQMPKIERSIAYTFDAYSGGMKVDFLAEQLPRRRRKVTDESKSSLMQNFATAISERKRAKAASDNDNSIGDLCKSEPNLSLLSSKISSLLSQELKHAKKFKKKMLDTIINNPDSNSGTNMDVGLFKGKGQGAPGALGGGCGVAGGLSEENLNAFKMRLFQTATAGNSQNGNRDDDMGEDEDGTSRDSILGNTPNSAQINLVETFLNNSSNGNHIGLDAQNSLQMLQSQLSEQQQAQSNAYNPACDNNFNMNAIVRNKEFPSAALLTSGLIQSKGSKKWMDDQMHNGSNDQANLHHHLHASTGQQLSGSSSLLPSVNRNFLSRLMNNGGPAKFTNNCAVENDDESSILDVVDNQNGQNKSAMANQMVPNDSHQHHHHQQQQQQPQHQFGSSSAFQEQISQLSQLPHSAAPFAHHQLPHNSLASFGNTYCNSNANTSEVGGDTNEDIGQNANTTNTSAATNPGRIVGSASGSTTASGTGNASASLLVEAALNSVTNMIEGASEQMEDCSEGIKGRLHARAADSRMNNNLDVDIDSIPNHENDQSAISHPVMPNGEDMSSVHRMANDDLDATMRNESGSYNDDMQEIENEVKLMKSLNSFQLNHSAQTGPTSGGAGTADNMQFPLSQQSSSSSTNGNQNTMNNNNNSDMMHENEIDVDNASTPRTLDRDSSSFRNYPPTTTPSPRDISPGQDYNQAQQRNAVEPGGMGQPQQHHHQNLFGMGRNTSYHQMNEQMGATPSPVANVNQHNPSPPILPRYGFSLNDICRKREYNQSSLLMQQQQAQHQQARRDNHLSSDEDSIMAQNLSVNHVNQAVGGQNNPNESLKMKGNPLEQHYNKYQDHLSNAGSQEHSDLRLKYGSTENASNMDLSEHFQRMPPTHANNNNANHSSSNDQQINEMGLDMSSRIGGYSHHNFQLSAAAAAASRYHHHIYDILSERDQQQPLNQSHHHLQNANDHQLQMQQEQHMMLAQQQQQQQDQSHLSDQTGTGNGLAVVGNADPDASDQTTSVDLSRTTSYVVTSPPALPYAGHPHSDMLRMVSMELNGANGNANAGNMMAANNHRTFLSGAGGQHNARMDVMESLHHPHHHRLLSSAEQHRLLASNTAAAAEQLTNPATNRLLVDPAHLLMESNNRSLLSAGADGRHMVQGRDFGSYHHLQHQVAAVNNYHGVHHPLVRPSAQSNHAANYHPFPTYY